MYNDAHVAALNSDRERYYAQLERERRQRETLAQRAAADAEPEAGTTRTSGVRLGGRLRIAHASR
ncbi:MAG: hypothetical protein ACTHON_05400 [Humibacter sp.]